MGWGQECGASLGSWSTQRWLWGGEIENRMQKGGGEKPRSGPPDVPTLEGASYLLCALNSEPPFACL